MLDVVIITITHHFIAIIIAIVMIRSPILTSPIIIIIVIIVRAAVVATLSLPAPIVCVTCPALAIVLLVFLAPTHITKIIKLIRDCRCSLLTGRVKPLHWRRRSLLDIILSVVILAQAILALALKMRLSTYSATIRACTKDRHQQALHLLRVTLPQPIVPNVIIRNAARRACSNGQHQRTFNL